ncbi:MAG TPA: ROK family protein [Chitinophagaceae bacterium]|jgi:glucokinase|nr:ROK family protein [Chitinophagaceae bacterium]
METVIGIDLGGTHIRGGLVTENNLPAISTKRANSDGSVKEVLQQLFILIDQLVNDSVKAIGIGVPGLVDTDQGIVYDVVNIPSWKKVPLKQLTQDRYHLPVVINNDANCFALGEYYFGKGQGYDSMIGLTIGTGLGSGIIINKKLYAGKNGGAGEFGMINYLDKYYEYYTSGQFFQNVYQTDGEIVFKQAEQGDKQALRMYEEMGTHLGNAIKAALYALDVELIILGGSVRHAYPYFEKKMWQQIKTFAFQKAVENLKIEISELENSGILGAAALYYQNHDFQD